MHSKSLKERGLNFPFNPARLPFFYGWLILILGAMGILMSIPGQTMGVSVFTGTLVKVLDMPRLRLSLTYMIGTILSSLFLSKAGKFYDRFGARITLFLAGALMALVLLFLSHVDRISGWISGTTGISMKISSFGLMVLGFFLLRYSGQGVMTMVSRSMVMKWFDKRRGIAAAILGIFTSFGFSYAPRVLDALIQHSGWRGAWQSLGLFCGLVFGVVALLLFRDNPQVCGLKPDSLRDIHLRIPLKKSSENQDICLKEAKRHPILWIFALSLALWALFNTAFTFHVVSIFQRAQWTRQEALAVFLPVSVVSVVFRFLISWISDHLRLEFIYLIYLFGMILSAGALLLLDWSGILWLLIPGMGIAGGIFGTLSSISWVRLFGKKHLGAISGFSMGWIVAGSAVGPYFFSLAEKLLGSYDGGAWFTLILSLLLSVILTIRWLRTRHSEKNQ